MSMYRQPFQSALRRGRTADINQTYEAFDAAAARCFSTTQWQLDSEDSRGRPPPATARERSAAAAAQLGELTRRSPSDGARTFAAPPSDGGAPAPYPTGTGPNIISVTSLPRGRGRGRGLVRGGRGGGIGNGNGPPLFQRTGLPLGPNNDFQRDAGAGAGGRGRGGAGRGRGGRGGRARGRNRDEDAAADEKKGSGPAMYSRAERAWMEAQEMGEPAAFRPSLTLEGLAGFSPAVGTDTRLGRVGCALRAMNVLGGGVPFRPDTYADAAPTRERYRRGRPVFFADPPEKEWALGAKVGDVGGPTDAVKSAILGAAVQGRYEAPKWAPVSDTPGTLQRYHAQDATYRHSDGQKFDAKATALLGPQASVKA